ncbi:MAG: ATP-binding protein [bacterium]
MLKRQPFRKRLFIYFSILFFLYTAVVVVYQYGREKEFRKSQLENTLGNITAIVHNYVENNKLYNKDINQLDSLVKIIPKENIRITIINPKGIVVYDNEANVQDMDNHKNRPEVIYSLSNDYGVSIRKSATTGESYFYLAKFYQDYYVRTAVLYNIDIKNLLKAETNFIFFILFVFVVLWVLIMLLTNRIGESITKLKDFAVRLHNGEDIKNEITFPNDELGAISSQIVDIYNELITARDELAGEKEKLFNHLFALNEGIAFFSAEKIKILSNNHFIQFLNMISEQTTITAEHIFRVKEFKPIMEFVDKQLSSPVKVDPSNLPTMEIDVQSSGKFFLVKCIIFQDKSFEILISETTKLEKRKRIKQEVTSNIAHELKTPVASILGYVETLLENDIEPEKRKYFLEKAYAQTNRLTELIDDIAILNKIEEAKDHFVFNLVNIHDLIKEVIDNLKKRLDEKNISVKISMVSDIMIKGNRSLLFSVFHNLVDNAIKYAGENVTITISNYMDDKNYSYFSFYDNGPGIPEEHLSRIFERFYRIDTGRSRKTGGTGLGLAIVKNAIQQHNGEISARNHKDGGLEFLFTLQK